MADSFDHPPATETYFQALVDHLRRSSGFNFHVPIFAPIFLCLVAGDQNLALRTNPSAISSMSKHVAHLFISLFGMPTQRLRVRPSDTPNDLLRGMLLGPHNTASPSSASPRRLGPSRSSGGRYQLPPRTASYPESNADAPFTPASSFFDYRHISRRLSSAASETGDEESSVRAQRPRSGRGFPGTLTEAETSRHVTLDTNSRPPHALVISGLEKASVNVQQTLWDVLRTRRIVIEDDDEEDIPGSTWNLPDEFIVVYISDLGDPRERLPISRSLLDRFSFCTSVPLQHPLAKPSSQGEGLRFARDQLDPLQKKVQDTPIPSNLQLFASAIISGTRHHPELDGTAITARCTRDFTDLIKASWVIFGGSESVGAPTEDHVFKVFKGVLGHRVRVRDGPGDQVLGSLFVTAVSESRENNPERRSVKDILNEVWAQVS